MWWVRRLTGALLDRLEVTGQQHPRGVSLMVPPRVCCARYKAALGQHQTNGGTAG